MDALKDLACIICLSEQHLSNRGGKGTWKDEGGKGAKGGVPAGEGGRAKPWAVKAGGLDAGKKGGTIWPAKRGPEVEKKGRTAL